MEKDKDLTQADIDEILALIGTDADLPPVEAEEALTFTEIGEEPTPTETDENAAPTEAVEEPTAGEADKAPVAKKKSVFLKKHLFTILMVVFSAIFLVSAALLVDYFINSKKQKQQHNELAGIVEQIQQQQQQQNPNINNNPADPDATGGTDIYNPLVGNNNPYVEVTHPVTGKPMNVLREYSTVYLMNTDMVGWIKIEGTHINYPVLQSPDNVNFYLKRDFYKEYSRHGSIYAYEMANLRELSTNITLYGHNMSDSSMFADLHKYTEQSFWEENKFIKFDTLSSHQTYKIFAVFNTTDLVDSGFAYHLFVDGDEETFNDFVTACKQLSLYDTGETPVYGDKLLTLSTCDNDVIDSHGRFVVVAKKVSI